MGYLLLSVALFCGAVKGFCGKKMSGRAQSIRQAVLLNLIRMLLCIVFCFGVILLSRQAGELTFTPMVLLISAVSGGSTAFFVVCWLLAVRKSAYMLMDVFLMLGTLVPILSGWVLFEEPVSLRQWGGFLMLVVAALIMCAYQTTIKTRLSFPSVLLLLACSLASGMTSISQKVFIKLVSDTPVSIFNLYTYVFSAVTLGVAFLVLSRKHKGGGEGKEVDEETEGSYSKTTFLYVLVMAAALTAHSYFLTKAALHLDSMYLYPLSQGASLILATLMAAIFFKERLTVKAAVGITLSFFGLLIINL